MAGHTNTERVTELEVNLAFQQKQLEDLDTEVRSLREELTRLRHDLLALTPSPRGTHPPLEESPRDL